MRDELHVLGRESDIRTCDVGGSDSFSRRVRVRLFRRKGQVMKKKPTPKRQWQPLQPGVNHMSQEKIDAMTQALGRAPIAGQDFDTEVWLNDKYVVHVRRRESGSVSSLSIRRQDRSWPRDWRDFQRIKNEIAGSEVEAFELYPAESRLVDTANQFWLWVCEPDDFMDVGFFDGRLVNGSQLAKQFGAGQRDFEVES
jgi:hypothetical protein